MAIHFLSIKCFDKIITHSDGRPDLNSTIDDQSTERCEKWIAITNLALSGKS